MTQTLRAVPVTSSRWHRLRAPTLVGGAVAAGCVLLVRVSPYQAGHYPVCPTYALAGIYCPGCGMLRATHDLLTGDLAGSLARNPLTPPLAILGIVAFIVWVVARWRGLRLVWDPPRWLPTALAVAFVSFTVARNVPGWTWLSPV